MKKLILKKEVKLCRLAHPDGMQKQFVGKGCLQVTGLVQGGKLVGGCSRGKFKLLCGNGLHQLIAHHCRSLSLVFVRRAGGWLLTLQRVNRLKQGAKLLNLWARCTAQMRCFQLGLSSSHAADPLDRCAPG